jgi:predicted metal-dependent phosphoesterase TrpH
VFSRADLHIHSTASDGKCTPRAIVAKAASIGLSIIALTDHDTIAGLEEAQAAGILHGIEVVPGIELSAQHEEVEVHVLGYFIQPHKKELTDKLEILKRARQKRALTILDRLQRLGLSIDWSQIKKHAAGEVIGRPHIARALVEAGGVPSVKAAFESYLNRGCPAYVPRYRLTPEEAITLIHKCKGAAVLAHPGQLPDLSCLGPLLEFNWQGIEIYHPDHSKEMRVALEGIADSQNLIVTGGSDFHGKDCGNRNLGACTTDITAVEMLRKGCQQR